MMLLFLNAFLLLATGIVDSASTLPKTTIRFTPDEVTYLNKKGWQLTFCSDPSYMPFEAVSEDGKHIGMAADFLALMSARSGIAFQLVPTSTWTESLEKAFRHEVDVLPVASSTEKRRVHLNFTKPYIEVQSVVATLLQQPFMNSLNDFPDEKYGIVKGYSHFDDMRQVYPGIKLVEIENYLDGLKRLQSGEIYGVLGNMATIGYSIQEAKMNNVKIAGRTNIDVLLCMASRNDEPELAGIMEKLAASVTETEKQAITNHWWGIKYEHPTDYWLIFNVVVGLLVAGIGFLFWLSKLRQINEKLAMANAQLDELNTQKGYYFSVIGHDLRNPFTAILGYTETLQGDLSRLTSQEITKMAGIINNRASQILDMLNQLLEWAKLELNRIDHDKMPVDLHLTVNEITRLFEPVANHKKVALVNEIPIATTQNLDPYMIGTILRNLISNALKYSPPGSTITLSFDSEKRSLMIEDQGTGMDAQTVKGLFDPKPKVSRLGTANEQGTGLGLTICHRYATEMGIKIHVKSELGKGTLFYLVMP